MENIDEKENNSEDISNNWIGEENKLNNCDKFKNFLDDVKIEKIDSSIVSKKLSISSLYNLIKCDYFDTAMLIRYLHEKDEIGILDLLINTMYEKHIDKSYFYVPQLCMMLAYKNYSESLENYILDRCIDRLKFSLKTNWIISSFISKRNLTNTINDPNLLRSIKKMTQVFESFLVQDR